MVKPEKHRGWLTGKAIRQPKEPKKRVIGSGEEPIGCEKNSRIALVGSSREPSFGQTVSKEAHMALRISQSATETL